MSEPGKGPAVDPLDAACRDYKDCVKCAKLKHGNYCIGENIRYSYNNNYICTDGAGSCKRNSFK